MLEDLGRLGDEQLGALLLEYLVGVGALDARGRNDLARLQRAVAKLLAIAGDDEAGHDRAADRRRISADLAAAGVEHVAPLLVNVGVERGVVPLRGLSRDQGECSSFSLAAEQK